MTMVLSIIVDIFLISLFVFFVVFFSKYGFAKTIYKLGKTWMSFFVSMILGPWVSGVLDKLFLRKAITSGVQNTLIDLVENNANGYNLEELFMNLPEGFVGFLRQYGISLPELEAEYGSYTEASEEIIRGMAERIATPCIEMVSGIIGHVLGFVVPLIFFSWLSYKIRSRRVPFFRYVDHVSGFITGALVGYCAALGLSMLVHTAFQVIMAFDSHSIVADIYNNSYLFKFLCEFDTFGAISGFFRNVLTRTA